MYIIIQSTVKRKKDAKKLAKLLIEKKLAACIQVSKIKSFYMWENKLCKDKEKLLSIKTKKEHYKKVEKILKKNHPYETPEIISMGIKKGSKEYFSFIKDNTK